MSQIVPQVTVGGVKIDVSSFRAQRGTYGAIGQCELVTDMERLKFAGLNIRAAVQAAALPEPSLPIVISISTDAGKTFTKLWVGDLDDSGFDFEGDQVRIRGRDPIARLYDDRVVLKQDEYMNKRPYEIAQALAKDYGLATNKIAVDTNQPYAGHFYEIDAVRLSLPRRKWDLLVFLARAVGWETYASLNQELVFGPPGTTGTPVVFTWKPPPGSAGTPIKNLKVDYQPRRNATFQILVLSYHPKTEDMTSERIMVLDQEITIDTFHTVKAGTYKGGATQLLRSAIASKLDGRPLYVFYPQGKNLQEVQGFAERMYYDIARKLFIASGEVDGNPALDLQQTMQLAEAHLGDLQGFAGIPLTMASIDHRFTMAKGTSKDAGYITEIKAHYLPAKIQASSVDPIIFTGGAEGA